MTIISCDTCENMCHSDYSICKDQDFGERRHIKLNFRNLPFSNLFTVSCPRNDVSTKHFKYLKERDFGESLKSLNLWTVQERQIRQDYTEVFKTYKRFTSLSVDKLFERVTNIKGTRGIH